MARASVRRTVTNKKALSATRAQGTVVASSERAATLSFHQRTVSPAPLHESRFLRNRQLVPARAELSHMLAAQVRRHRHVGRADDGAELPVVLREEHAAAPLQYVASQPLEVSLVVALAVQRLLDDHVEILLVLLRQRGAFLADLAKLLLEM